MKQKKQLFEKGDCGYINQHKIRQLFITLISLIMVAVIFYTGVLRYHNTKSIFTVIAAVAAIPTAKVAVSYLVMMKYKSCDRPFYEEAVRLAPDSLILADLLISSTENILPAPVAVIRDNSVYLFTGLETDSIKKSETYIRTILETEARVTNVKLFNRQEAFFKGISMLNGNAPGKFDETIKKLLLIYSL
ncbi:MAG: hypothetical protein HFI34_01535 [Lachnospiraceae bacterium]|nr:hypothetical protein [Lachnospiraceae bacterium]